LHRDFAAAAEDGMSGTEPEWSEADSRLYRELAAIAVPGRAEQIAALLALAPFAADAPFRIVELGCGEGRLGLALLSFFPQARYLGLDGSHSMRQETGGHLRRFGERAEIAAFDLAAIDWLDRVRGADLAVSSLVVHHLSGDAKRALFNALHERLSPRGALLLADLVEPARPEARALFAGSWDAAVADTAAAAADGDELRRRFAPERWNYYRYPDPADRPSPLFEQLLWLREAGFRAVDCFWMRAGHAIYGGYMTEAAAGPPEEGRWERALAVARAALDPPGSH
jgi:tRNA (cmo5U34)-methyltransferase